MNEVLVFYFSLLKRGWVYKSTKWGFKKQKSGIISKNEENKMGIENDDAAD